MNHKNELISIIIPAYNSDEYIEKCILSVCEQTYSNIEIIIVDDGSIDHTGEICEKMSVKDDRIKYIKKTNGGVVSARQQGIKNASGKYVTFVDADDWVESNYIQTFADGIEDADMISAGVIWEEQKNKKTNRRDLFLPGCYSESDLEDIYEHMIYDYSTGITHSITCWMVNKMFNREMADEILMKIDPSLKVFEDAAFVYQYMLKCRKIILSDRYTYHYRYNEISAWHKIDPAAMEKIGRTYDYMFRALSKAPAEYGLIRQLQYWFFEKSYFTLNERMGMIPECRMIRFLLDMHGMEGKQIVIYGAGRCGKDIHFQLRTANQCEIVLWVDQRYAEYRKDGLEVYAPKDIQNIEYDMILVSVEDRYLAEKIVCNLTEMGIDKSKLAVANVKRVF